MPSPLVPPLVVTVALLDTPPPRPFSASVVTVPVYDTTMVLPASDLALANVMVVVVPSAAPPFCSTVYRLAPTSLPSTWTLKVFAAATCRPLDAVSVMVKG